MATELSADNTRLGNLGQSLFRIGLVVGVIGLLISFALAFGDPERFYRSYLMAFLFGLTICLGALMWTMVQHATRSGWSVTLRRIWEALAANLTWYWILFIPVVIGLFSHQLFEWADPALRDPASGQFDELIAHKSPFLNTPFWLIRAVIYFAVWAFLGWFFYRHSVRQDETGDVNETHRMQWLAPLGILFYALTQSGAAVDWGMSLSPRWFSTMFPVYFFAGSMTGFFSVSVLVTHFLQRNGRLTDEVSSEHYQDLGKLLFAFGAVFWAYIAYSQYMLIWYANIPEETTWFLARQLDGWLPVSVLLILGHFALPLLLLVSRHPKRWPVVLATIAVWMVLLHAVDMFYLVMPTIPHEILHDASTYSEAAALVTAEDVNAGVRLVDLTCLLGVAGLLTAGTARMLGACSLVPQRDPRLDEALAFENI